MNNQHPTTNPQIGRSRILLYVQRTHERVFTFDDVGVQFLTLKRLVKARLLAYCHTRSDANLHLFPLPVGAAARQEMRFCKELVQLRGWCNSTRCYVFRAREVGIKGWILNGMVFGGMKYRVLWTPLLHDWKVIGRAGAGKDEIE